MLTERYGLKPQGKAAPMAASKIAVDNNNAQSWNFGVNSNINPKPSNVRGDQNRIFDSIGDSKPYNSGASGHYDDIFVHINPPKQSFAGGGGGSSFDYESFFSYSNGNTSSFHAYGSDDIFDGMPGVKSSISANNDSNSDDIFGPFASPPKQSAPIDDLLGDFVQADAKPEGSSGNTTSNFDDLIPGFGDNIPPNDGYV